MRNSVIVFNLLLLILITSLARAQSSLIKSPKKLQEALNSNPNPDQANAIAALVREWFGQETLTKGNSVKTDGLTAAWALEAPGAKDPPVVMSDSSHRSLQLTKLGDSDIYVHVENLPEGAGFRWHYIVDGRRLGGGNIEVYTTPADMKAKSGVPKGIVTQQSRWKSSIFAGTERDWWIYIPQQYKPESPACVMIFQDGGGYKNYVPAAFDNLIAKGEMPVTVGIFISPGNFADGRSNRSFEYDTLSDHYARFLLEEILPEVEKNIKLRHDAASRAIGGISSGGICAWTVAWERPNEFSKVLSWVGSFTGIASGKTLKEGGNNYPVMIRKSEKKPIRIFMQDGENDLDNENGNWPLANQEISKALDFKGYQYKFVYGHGFHSDNHGRAILPDSLRWLWKDYKPE